MTAGAPRCSTILTRVGGGVAAKRGDEGHGRRRGGHRGDRVTALISKIMF
jgi:hypothetical protein